MAVSFNNNNNSELQMLFGKINNGSPFLKSIEFLSTGRHDFGKDLDTTFDQNYNSLYYRQSSAQNIKINEIANNAFINEINLTSAIIDKIEYHFRDNTFHFIFDVSNKFLSGKSRLTIEVPRVKLENIKLPDMKEIYVNQWYINIFINTLIFSINEGSYTLTGV
ncbi:hypothetical protein VN0963_08570 [Helicobacter pylori]